MFKKLMSLSIAGLLVVSMVGCSSTVEDNKVEEPQVHSTIEKVEEGIYGEEHEVEQEMNTILVDNEDIKITILSRYEKSHDVASAAGYRLKIENKADYNMYIYAHDVSVDGVMVDPVFAPEIVAGKTLYDSLCWTDAFGGEVVITTLNQLKNVEGYLSIQNEAFEEIYRVDFVIE